MEALDQAANQAPARLYNGLTMVAHIVRTVAPDSSWRTDLAAHLRTHPTGDLAAMGFPADWEARPLWSAA